MRILSIHNRYQRAGGEDEVFRATTTLLRERGHDVVQLVDDNERIRQLGALRTAAATVWSQASYSKVRRMLQANKFDLLDVHNTFPLISPAIYYAARAEGVPVVQTLHNYRLLCASATLYRDGRVCLDCVGRTPPLPAVQHACYRDSRAGTAAVVAMQTTHRLLGTWTSAVDMYVALSSFQRRQLIAGGLPEKKVMVKPNFVHPDPGVGKHEGEFVLYVGRLAREKGIRTLLAAWQQLRAPVPLKIIGDGPLAPEVARAAERLGTVEWLGQRSRDETIQAMGEALTVVVPSEWHEPFGLVVIEAFARGTPVVTSDAGGLPEMVNHGHTGLISAAGDPARLADQIAWAWAHPNEMAAMGRAARNVFERTYTAESNYAQLTAIFRAAGAG